MTPSGAEIRAALELHVRECEAKARALRLTIEDLALLGVIPGPEDGGPAAEQDGSIAPSWALPDPEDPDASRTPSLDEPGTSTSAPTDITRSGAEADESSTRQVDDLPAPPADPPKPPPPARKPRSKKPATNGKAIDCPDDLCDERGPVASISKHVTFAHKLPEGSVFRHQNFKRIAKDRHPEIVKRLRSSIGFGSVNSVKRWANGSGSPPEPVVVALCRILNVDRAELVAARADRGLPDTPNARTFAGAR